MRARERELLLMPAGFYLVWWWESEDVRCDSVELLYFDGANSHLYRTNDVESHRRRGSERLDKGRSAATRALASPAARMDALASTSHSPRAHGPWPRGESRVRSDRAGVFHAPAARRTARRGSATRSRRTSAPGAAFQAAGAGRGRAGTPRRPAGRPSGAGT